MFVGFLLISKCRGSDLKIGIDDNQRLNLLEGFLIFIMLKKYDKNLKSVLKYGKWIWGIFK